MQYESNSIETVVVRYETTKVLKSFMARSLAEDCSNTFTHKFLEDSLLLFEDKKVWICLLHTSRRIWTWHWDYNEFAKNLAQADEGTGMNHKSMELSVDPARMICTKAIWIGLV